MTGRDPLDDVTLFVNSVDSYSDCWDPFFHLLATYWPDCPQPVLLNSGRLPYSHDAVDVHAVRGSLDVPDGVELPWGERFARGLADVTSTYTLYIVEDAFLEAPVRVDVLRQIVALMQHERLDCVRLVEPEGAGPYQPTRWPLLWEVDRGAEYLAMLQAAVWRTDVLASLINPRENPWQFETRGGRRIRQQGVRIHCVNRDTLWLDTSQRVLPYDPVTGVVMGRWREDVVVPLFGRHGIEVDLSARGSLSPLPRGPVQVLTDRLRGKLRTLRHG